ncbi:MAG: hypothetical protein V3571_11130 [Pseudodesulfovibrio sp.]
MNFRYLALLCCLLPVFVLPARAGQTVLLHSAAAPDGWTRSVLRGLCPVGGAGCAVAEIFLGPDWSGEDFFGERYEQLCPQWCAAEPDAVLADGGVAFAFARKYRGELFGAAPVVHLGLAGVDDGLAGQCGRCAGVSLRLGVAATVDLIFRLRPQTAIVVGITDDAVENEPVREAAEAAMQPYLDRARLLFPGHEPGDDSGLDRAALDAAASSVPVAGAVLYLGFSRDNAGNGVDEGEAVRSLARRSPAPVFVLTDRFIGEGVIGGVVARGEDQARLAAILADRLRQDPSASLEPRSAAPRPVIDLTVLARFGIAADRLPEGAIGLNPAAAPEPASAVTSVGGWGLAALLAVPAWLAVRRLRAKQIQ